MKKYLLVVIIISALPACKQNKKLSISPLFFRAYQKGDSLADIKNDSAFYYFNEAADLANAPFEKAGAYNRMALIQFNTGDYYGSLETVTLSQNLLDEKNPNDHPYLLPNYNLLGRIYLEQKNYQEAVVAFEKAKALQEVGKFNATLQNNLGVAYQKLQDFTKAKILFKMVMDSSRLDTIVFARALSNLARTKWLEYDTYPAAGELLTALSLREIKGDRGGIKTSCSHLADYYLLHAPDSSLFFGRRMFTSAENADDTLEAIKKITRVSSAQEAIPYAAIFYRVNDSLKLVRNNSASQFAIIRYEAEKSKAENLRLQRHNFQQRIIVLIVIGGSVLLLLLAAVWLRRRKKRMEKESQDKIREQQLKTSKKIHDVVANGLYGVMAELEYTETINREHLIDKIDRLYEQSRDISHEHKLRNASEYSTFIYDLLSSFGNSYTQILIAGNNENIWEKLTIHEKTRWNSSCAN